MKGSEIVGHSCSIYGIIPEVDIPRNILETLLNRTYLEFISDVNYPLVMSINLPDVNQYRLPSYVGEIIDVKFTSFNNELQSRRVNLEEFFTIEPSGYYVWSVSTDAESKSLFVKPLGDSNVNILIFYRPVESFKLDDEIPLPREFHYALIDGLTKNLGIYLISKGYDVGRLSSVIQLHQVLFERHKVNYRKYLSRDSAVVVKAYDPY